MGLGIWVEGLDFRVMGLGLGFGVWGFGFRAQLLLYLEFGVYVPRTLFLDPTPIVSIVAPFWGVSFQDP